MKKNKKIISLEIPEELGEILRHEAEEHELSVSALIRYIIKQYYKNKKENK